MIARFNLPLDAEYTGLVGYGLVIIYPDAPTMRVAARKYSSDPTPWDDAEALWQGNVCHPSYPCTTDHRFLGVMRLQAQTDVATVTHECVHAAVTAVRLKIGHTLNLGSPFYDHLDRAAVDERPEELLAYAAGDLTATCLARLSTLTDLGVVVTP